MPTSCAASGCRNSVQQGSTLSFHKFPLRDPKKLAIWLQELRRGSFKPSSSHTLCSNHFESWCYIPCLAAGSRRRLIEEAYPTIFDFPKPLQKDKNHRRVIKRRHKVAIIERSEKGDRDNDKNHRHVIKRRHEEAILETEKIDCDNGLLEPEAAMPSLSVKLDHPYAFDTTQSPQMLKCKLDFANTKISSLQKKLKLQYRKVQRKQSQIDTGKELLTSLKSPNIL
ncbi:PREDICTED: THAP domain-containing protein 1-like [Priapulus caudatus]|uniref:THAP domain-containing protein 1-like n=1 Tax=Priapulus caudatus TaxID=37621 RepID=A0ABM1ECL1_PRICU|nr:PREDICTED: THAP domain-containing protein 1-like [Priapulus caudatus]XP_014669932.1 PREDICTED: THAP domain-containing protein 1-like [Priapulus caudatus]XP_014669933.1 PREDICTED: THAP domain-containing protein 1-like [Priapulus caudatus]XP_014669934.1 PREDICTED: THAP domain-containing protein 1-like [Priapulus caudatus]